MRRSHAASKQSQVVISHLFSEWTEYIQKEGSEVFWRTVILPRLWNDLSDVKASIIAAKHDAKGVQPRCKHAL